MSSIHPEALEYARIPEGIVVIRVNGKGNHQNSVCLRRIFELTRADNPRYIIDLDHCVTMDSTFMGTMASIALHQKSTTASLPIVTNIKDHVRRLLETLGLKYLLDMRAGDPMREQLAQTPFQPAETPEPSKLDRIVMMIEAHERLLDVDSENEIKFEGVLKSLRDSLQREQGKND
ncbi:MAG: STAS domain-containing protein [bacterium]|nr:STAS domain-containing protein [bacterium]